MDTIRRTASELITGIEERLETIRKDREVSQEQTKECILLIQNDDLSEFSLLDVYGMDRLELIQALFTMNADDKLSIPSYLESKGAWVTEIGNQDSREYGEYHLDVRYNTDTEKLFDMKERKVIELESSDVSKEVQLLHGDTDKYGIYQLKDNSELDKFRFRGTESLKRMGIIKDNFDAVLPENYKLVYLGELSELQGQTQSETLEAIYTKFNIDHPADYKAHSLSVSDIVVLHENGENSAHFVDSFGFTEMPTFMLTLEGKENEIETELAVESETIHVTFTVAECGEFHNMGEYHEGIETIEEAIRIYQAIDPSRINGIPSIGVNVHIEGTKEWEDDQTDILNGNCLDIEILDYTPEIRDIPKVQEALKKLSVVFPEKEFKQQGRISLKERLVEKQNRVSSRQENIDKEHDKSQNNSKEI